MANKFYMETKKGTLEQSVLDVWKEASRPDIDYDKPKTHTSPKLRRKHAQAVQKADAAAMMVRAKKGIRPKNLGIISEEVSPAKPATDRP